MSVVPFPRWRSETAMARDAWRVALHVRNATERSMMIAYIRDMIAAGVEPAVARDAGARYAAELSAWVHVAEDLRRQGRRA